MTNNNRSYRKGNPRGTKTKYNARFFARSEKIAVQRLAIRLYEQEDLHPEIIASHLGISVRSVYRWISWFKNKGWDAFLIKAKPRQRKSLLNSNQLADIIELITTKLPSDIGYETMLWTRKIISEEIKKRFSLSLCETSVGRLLRKNGISPQKPIRRSYKQDKNLVNKFTKETFPDLVRKAKSEGAEILWLDESQIVSDANNGRTWGVKGKTPIISANGSKEKINVIGTIDQNGQTDSMTYDGYTDTSVIVTYVDSVLKKRVVKST